MPDQSFLFRHRFRVRYSELDPQGVVFNARYLDYGDLLVTEHWRAAGVDTDRDDPFETHVARALVTYRKPIRRDEEIDGIVRSIRFGNTSMTILMELHGAGQADLRATIELVHVHVDLESGAKRPIPQAVRTALGAPGATSIA